MKISSSSPDRQLFQLSVKGERQKRAAMRRVSISIRKSSHPPEKNLVTYSIAIILIPRWEYSTDPSASSSGEYSFSPLVNFLFCIPISDFGGSADRSVDCHRGLERGGGKFWAKECYRNRIFITSSATLSFFLSEICESGEIFVRL